MYAVIRIKWPCSHYTDELRIESVWYNRKDAEKERRRLMVKQIANPSIGGCIFSVNKIPSVKTS